MGASARSPHPKPTKNPVITQTGLDILRYICSAGITSHGLDGNGPEPVAKLTGSRDCSRSQRGSFSRCAGHRLVRRLPISSSNSSRGVERFHRGAFGTEDLTPRRAIEYGRALEQGLSALDAELRNFSERPFTYRGKFLSSTRGIEGLRRVAAAARSGRWYVQCISRQYPQRKRPPRDPRNHLAGLPQSTGPHPAPRIRVEGHCRPRVGRSSNTCLAMAAASV